MKNVSVEAFGASGILVRFSADIDAAAFARGRGVIKCLSGHAFEGLQDITPGYGSALLEFSGAPDLAALAQTIRELLGSAISLPADQAPLHEIPVRYDGPDLARLAERLRMDPAELIRLHADREYEVRLLGFSPGFPYLGPLDSQLHVPRLSAPRVRVPAGSVAIGGSHTGIYSIASPGGWWLIGRTDVTLFAPDLARGAGSESAFLLQPGDRVKFLIQEP